MKEAAQRLRQARARAGFRSARAAARALGVAESTYGQHERGERAFSLAQAERYSAFFHAAKLIHHFKNNGLELPEREVLAALIFDTINTPGRWATAPEDLRVSYRTAVDAVAAACGLTIPDTPEIGSGGPPEGS